MLIRPHDAPDTPDVTLGILKVVLSGTLSVQTTTDDVAVLQCENELPRQVRRQRTRAREVDQVEAIQFFGWVSKDDILHESVFLSSRIVLIRVEDLDELLGFSQSGGCALLEKGCGLFVIWALGG